MWCLAYGCLGFELWFDFARTAVVSWALCLYSCCVFGFLGVLGFFVAAGGDCDLLECYFAAWV